MALTRVEFPLLGNYDQGGTGAVPRTAASRLAERISVADFGAVGDGSTDDTTAIQAAIDAAEARGNGATVYFPFGSTGTYLISSTLTVEKGIWLRSEGFGDENNAASPNTGTVRLLWKAGSGASPMVQVKSATASNRVYYGGIDGLKLDGNDEATKALFLSSTQGFRIGTLYTTRTTTYGTHIDNSNGVLSSLTHIDVLRHLCGGNAASRNCVGLFIDGDQNVNGATSHWIGEFEAEYVDGDALQIRAVDTCYFGRVKCIERETSHVFGGTALGYGVRFMTSATALQAQKNYIAHLGRGTVYVEDDTLSNAIGFINGEGGAVVFEAGASGGDPGTLDYKCVDRQHGDIFETLTYKISTETDVQIGGALAVTGSPVYKSAGGFPLVYWAFAPGATESIVKVIPPDPDWSNGNITGIRVGLIPEGSATPNDVVFNIILSTISAGGAVGSGERDEDFTWTVDTTANTVSVEEQSLASALPYTRGDTVFLKVSRLGGDVADDFPNDCGLLWVQLLYESDGPDSAGTGPWGVPARYIT